MTLPSGGSKPGPTLVGNLAKAIKALKKDPKDLTDEVIQQMTMDLLLDAPDDENGSAARLKIKLECLRLLHDINNDNENRKAKQQEEGDDFGQWTPPK